MEPTVVRREPAPSGGSPVLYAVLGAMALALVGAAGYIYINRQPAKTTEATVPVPTTLAETVTTAPPSTTLAVAPPTPTLAPFPTLPKGPTRSDAMKAAQAAFARNDYDQAIAQAQKALAADPTDAQAKSLVENALKGQQAESRFAAAETALRQGQLDRAMSEADAGRVLANWDPRGPSLISRIQQAKQQAEHSAQQQAERAAQQQRVAQVNNLLGQADAALSAAKYDDAIRSFDEVLKLDGQNQRAIMGKSTAVQARALAAAGAGGGRGAAPGRTFVSAKTTAQSVETRTSSNVPEGFMDTPGVDAKKGSQAAELPGKIVFDIDPEAVKPNETYTVKVYLFNGGNAPIQVREMLVRPSINGKGVTAPVAAQTKDVAPQQQALLMSTRDIWREDTTAWSMEVTVRTVRGETYKNQVTWK
jgi:hypothetical protein